MARLRYCLPIAAAASAAVIAQSASAFEFHGYMRSGVGFNSKGGDQVCFQAPGARAKYRLGNECETYVETAFAENLFEGENNSYFKVQFLFAHVVQGENDFEEYNPAMRESYIEAGNLFGGFLQGAKFWVGKRFYRRHDIHINDFYYWSNEGPGGGIEDLDLGFGKFAFAFRPNVNDNFDSFSVEATQEQEDGSEITVRRTLTGDRIQVNDEEVMGFDFRVYDIDVNEGGQLTVGVDYRYLYENTNINFPSDNGWWLNLQHFQEDLLGGYNKIDLQFANGLNAGMVNTGDPLLNDDAQTWRLVEQLMWQPTEDFSGMLAFVYEYRNDWGFTNNVKKWISVGARPKYYFNDFFDVSVEAGYDFVDPVNGDDMDLFKFTIAPELSAGRGFFARPALRAFATYATWNSAAGRNGVVLVGNGNNPFEGDGAGWTFGLQAEAWW